MNVEDISRTAARYETIFEWAQNHADLFKGCYSCRPGGKEEYSSDLVVVGQGNFEDVELLDGMEWSLTNVETDDDGQPVTKFFEATKRINDRLSLRYVGVQRIQR
jgi:hypothetical protein